jgi:hypothetical protein
VQDGIADTPESARQSYPPPERAESCVSKRLWQEHNRREDAGSLQAVWQWCPCNKECLQDGIPRGEHNRDQQRDLFLPVVGKLDAHKWLCQREWSNTQEGKTVPQHRRLSRSSGTETKLKKS